MSTRRENPRGNPANDGEPGEGSINLYSGVSPAGKPFVHLQWGDKLAQLDVDECRQFGMRALECAEAAEHDAIVNAWLKDKLKIPVKEAAMMIADLRTYRADDTASTIGAPPKAPDDDALSPTLAPGAVAVGTKNYYSSGRQRPELLEAPTPGQHLWFVATTYTLTEESVARAHAGGRVDLDAENLAMVATGCFVCERSYSPELASRECAGEPAGPNGGGGAAT